MKFTAFVFSLIKFNMSVTRFKSAIPRLKPFTAVNS